MKHLLLTSALIAGLMTGAQAGEEKTMSDIEHFRPQAFKDIGLPFSAAVKVGDTLYLSGQIGNVPGTKGLVEGGIQAETRQTLENIKMTLEKYGSDLDHVIKCQVFMADMVEWDAMNAVYVTYFNEDKMPARSALGASGLALDARVEIECLAVIK